jgi:transposase InsO family protein
MAVRVIPMKAMAAVLAFVAGQPMNVAQVCREVGISRETFYKYVARCRADPQAGFEPRSRRAHSHPGAVGDDVEEAVIRWRKVLAEAGLDHGATTIQWHLGRDEQFTAKVPSVATVHRILVRRGFITPTPQKRPKTSWRRFEAPAPNEWWQFDHTDWVIAASPGLVKVFNVIDDHSRVACASRAVTAATSEEAWTTFCAGVQQWGLPAGVLSDNGLCFSGKLRGFEVLFEARLRDAGIRPITGRPYHPQTTGKVERFQQTLKRWLRHHDHRHGLACDLAELQSRLEEFRRYYNEQRPHQGIGRTTPLSRWQATTPALPSDSPLAHPEPLLRPEPHHVTVNDRGVALVDDLRINVGSEWAGCDITVIIDRHHATIFCDTVLVRHLRLDRSRRYQPSGRLRGGPHQTRRLQS